MVLKSWGIFLTAFWKLNEMLHLQNILASIVNSALQAYSQLCLLFSKITGQTVNHKILQLKNLKKIEVTSTLYWRRRWHPIPVLLPGKPHGWRSLIGCSTWGCKELDMTEWLHFHSSLSCIGEGNGNPLQCSCLENPRDGGAWWLLSIGSHRVGHDWSDLAAEYF